jgi:hypothetical protein
MRLKMIGGKILLFSSEFPRQGVRPVREGVSTYSLKFHAGPPCPTLIRPAGGPPPKRPYSRLGGGPPTGRAACGRLLPPLDTPSRTGLQGVVLCYSLLFWPDDVQHVFLFALLA